jgi:iron complex outermembrane recepter protein
MRTDTQRFRRTVVSRAVITALWGTAAMVASQETLAQQTSLERVEITGSAIRRVDAETALPVTVIKTEDLKQQGYTTVQDIVNSIAGNQSFQGTSAAIGAVTGGAALANLRGLGANKTLVLLNGRRIANQAVGGSGDSSAPDLNSIPLGAIERIEVLRDGASSLYGTDAIGGVINFITKKDYAGAEASAEYTSPQHAGGKSWEANLGFGHGDLDKDKWNVFGFIDYQHQDVLTTPQRPSFATSNKTSPTGFPGTWSQAGLNLSGTPGAPACTGQYQAATGGPTCGYLYWNFVDLIPKTNRLTGMIKGTLALPGDHQLGLEYTTAKTDVWTNVAGVPEGNLSIFPSSPYYPAGADPTYDDGTHAVGYAKVRWRTVPAGPRADHNETTQQRFVASLDGTIAGWDYNTGFTYNTVKTGDTLIGGYVSDSAIRDAVANGTLDPFNSNLPADQLAIVQGAVLPGKLFDAKGTTFGWDGRISRELGDWFGAGRKTALAVGAEWRHEKYTEIASGLGDPNSYPSQVVSSTGFDPNTDNEGSRSVWAAYAELNMPITKSLEATVSGRYDKYPDFGSTFNPKLSMRFQPAPSWLARGSVTTGFRAPSLYELHSAQTFTNTANNWNDPQNTTTDASGNCVAKPGFSTADNCNVQFMALTGGNTHLTPEKSKSATFGFVLQPAPEFDASLDFWWVRMTNAIGALSDTTVFGDPSTYASHFVRAPNGTLATDGSQCNTVASPGPECGYVVLLNDNLGGVRTNGIDLAASYRMRTGMGNLTFHFQDTYVSQYRFQTQKDGPWFDAVGVYANVPGTTGGAPVFRNQFTLSAQWAMGPWAAGLVNHYKSGYLDQDGVNQVGSYSTFDLYGSWSPNKQITITAGVKNVLDKKPPTSNQDATFQVGYDPRFADALLRAYYIRAQYKF